MKLLFIPVFLSACAMAWAQSTTGLEGGIRADVEDLAEERNAQEQVAALDDDRQNLAAEYRAVLAQLESAQIYNAQMEKIIGAQEQEKDAANTQLDTLTESQRELIPLMLRMIETLDTFVMQDIPFLPDERTNRIEQLQSLMDRGDVSLSEKYRRVLEAFQIEMDYARTLETYSGELTIDGSERIVEFLRFGRLALFAKTPDGTLLMQWDPDATDWVEIKGGGTVREILRGYRIAARQTAPTLLQIPVPAPQKAN